MPEACFGSRMIDGVAHLHADLARTGGDLSILEPDALAGRPRPGAVRMLPSLAGERTPTWNAAARGHISGLGLETDARDLVLAAMEGTALALADDLEMLAGMGLPVDLIRSTGGGSVNPVWLQIKADVTGCSVERPTAGSGAAQGAAFLAGLAVGDITGVAELRSFAVAITQQYEPDPTLVPQYRERLTEFRGSRTGMRRG